ncbi:hypothetical protein [Haloactinopolyspora sp.]|uniref:hypothetical protein n=1 Tax=Haloactinopolyspora sp. TaxID=1966353 RepID=UPI0026070AAE|nr:hypothetical protein [Haloactinopolyspora sp.]
MKVPGQLNPDDYRHEIALSRKIVAELEHGGDWIEIETFAGALDMADELLAEVERLRGES